MNQEKLTGWDGGNRCCAAAELRAAASSLNSEAGNRVRDKKANKEAVSQGHENMAIWESTRNESTARKGEWEMMLRPAVAGFTYAKLTPLLGWPGGLCDRDG